MRRRGGGEEVRKHTHLAAHAQPDRVAHARVHEAVAKGACLAHSHRKMVGAARHQPRVPAAPHLHLLPRCKPVGPPAARTMRTRRPVSRVR